MDNPNINIEKIQTNGSDPILHVYTGQALPQREPKKWDFGTTITGPANWLQENKIDPKECVLLISTNHAEILLRKDINSFYECTIGGALKTNPDFIKWRINNLEPVSCEDLANFIKMNKFFFKDRTLAMKLSSELRNFRVKIRTSIEKTDNLRGNVKDNYESELIEHNIPESFNLTLPLFIGEKPETIEVEIQIDRNYNCVLISPQAKEIEEETKKLVIERELQRIKELQPNLAVLYV